MKKRMTLYDLAQKLDLSPSTISRALKNDERISEATRARVSELAIKLGYRPNPFAVSLQKKSSGLLGLIISDIDHIFFIEVLQGILNQAETEGYQVITCLSQNHLHREKAQVTRLLAAGVDGVLVCYTTETHNFSHFQPIIDQNLPLVLFDRDSEELDVPAVISDDFQGAQLAVQHLIDQGRKKIMHIRGPEALSISFYRYMGYRETLQKNGLTENPDWVIEARGDKGDFLAQDPHWIPALKEVDAVFAFTDYAAYQAMIALRKIGRRIPEDVALVGFGDLPMARYLTPTLSSIKQPAYRLGTTSVSELVKRVKYPQQKLEFPTLAPPSPPAPLANTLVVRESSKCRG